MLSAKPVTFGFGCVVSLIRSRSTVSVGDADTTLGSQTTDSNFGIESAVADRVFDTHRMPPPRRL